MSFELLLLVLAGFVAAFLSGAWFERHSGVNWTTPPLGPPSPAEVARRLVTADLERKTLELRAKELAAAEARVALYRQGEELLKSWTKKPTGGAS